MIRFITIRLRMFYSLLGWCWHEWDVWIYPAREYAWQDPFMERFCKNCKLRQRKWLK